MVAGELVSISYVSTDSRRFVRVTVKMAVKEYTRDATGKIASMSLVGPIDGYHVQPCTTWMTHQQTNGVSWDLGKRVDRLTPESSGLAYVWECVLQGAKDDSVIQDPYTWADRAIMGCEEYNAAMEVKEAQEREEYSATERSLNETLRELGMGMDAHGNAYEL